MHQIRTFWVLSNKPVMCGVDQKNGSSNAQIKETEISCFKIQDAPSLRSLSTAYKSVSCMHMCLVLQSIKCECIL